MLDLTLIITVKNRKENVNRILHFYKNESFKIILAESSDEPIKGIERCNWIEYQYYPKMNYFDKMYNVYKTIDTKYTIECADDDLVIKSAISKCVEFLDKNLDYVCVDGQYSDLYIHVPQSGFQPDEFKNNLSHDGVDVKVKYPEAYISCTNEQFYSDNTLGRIENILNKSFYARNHACFRSDIILKCFKFFQENKSLAKINYLERLLLVILSKLGNVKTLPILYQIRSTQSRVINQPKIKEEMKNTTPLRLLEAEDLLSLANYCDISKNTLYNLIKNHFETENFTSKIDLSYNFPYSIFSNNSVKQSEYKSELQECVEYMMQ